ncbi:MAG: hypothetical protein E7616_04790 [Ruminococcaceae bacterium]|nr:hypothetical protein [Oscillospiraceae bacterium]
MAITPDSVSFLSGLVKACRILCLVFSILCMLGGVAFAILSTMLNTPEACEAFVGEFQAFLFYFSTVAFPDLADPSLAPALAGSLAFVFIVISLLLLFIGYFLFFKKAHRFIQSVKEYLKTGTLIENTSSLFVWLLVFGILMAIISVLSGLAVLYEGCSAAALILSAVWVHKYFS